MATIILQLKKSAQTKLVMNLLRQLRIKTHRINDEKLEDVYLTRLIDKGMAEK